MYISTNVVIPDVCLVHARARKGQRASILQELKLKMVVSDHVGYGNPTLVLCKNKITIHY